VKRNGIAVVLFLHLVGSPSPAVAQTAQAGNLTGVVTGYCDMTVDPFPLYWFYQWENRCVGPAGGGGTATYWEYSTSQTATADWSAAGATVTLNIVTEYEDCLFGLDSAYFPSSRMVVHPVRVEEPDGFVATDGYLITNFGWERNGLHFYLYHGAFVYGQISLAWRSSDGYWRESTANAGVGRAGWIPQYGDELTLEDYPLRCLFPGPLPVRIDGGRPEASAGSRSGAGGEVGLRIGAELGDVPPPSWAIPPHVS
jgi:hypothetical protein